MQFSFLVLVLGVAAVSSDVIDINQAFDEGVAKINNYLREHRRTVLHVPKGALSANVTFFGSEVVGLDSWKRTGNCTLEVVDKNVTLEYHWGLGLFQQTFRILNINGQEMSGGFRIKDNSVHMHFTIYNFGDKELCTLALHDLSYERLAGVDFYSSRAEYDGIDVEDFFEKELTPSLNNKIDIKKIEKIVQSKVCRQRHMEISEHMQLIHSAMLEQLGISSQ